MPKTLFAILVFCAVVLVPLALGAQDDSPKEGVLTGDKVRVRTGASTKHRILVEMRKGGKVSVISKEGDWLKIEMPEEVILWISKRYVKEVKEGDKLIGELTADKVNVRTGIGSKDVKVGQVDKGDKVRIVGSKEGWYKIRPPKGFTAYMFAKYVKVGEDTNGSQDNNGTGDTNGTTPQDTYEQRLAKLHKQIEILRQETKKLQDALEKEKKKEKEFEEKLRKAEELVRGYDQEKQEIAKKYKALLEEIRTGSKPKAKYTAEGYVEDIGKLINPPPAKHRLVISRGSKPRYYLRSADESINLDNYLRQRVGVIGVIVKEKYGDEEVEVIKVTIIAILEK
jgi:uncharacterized protein YgiM (DUF1202 family)